MRVSLRQSLLNHFRSVAKMIETLDFIGGPGGTRTPNQTVMSGGTAMNGVENCRESSLFGASRSRSVHSNDCGFVAAGRAS